MKRISKLVVLVVLIELVIGAALGTRIRKQLEKPISYLGAVERGRGAPVVTPFAFGSLRAPLCGACSAPTAEPLHVG